jgi:hypothetical protein
MISHQTLFNLDEVALICLPFGQHISPSDGMTHGMEL